MGREKHSIVLVASPHARDGETSPFLRFIREHDAVLKRFAIHCTGGTAVSLAGTGMYSTDPADDQVHKHLPGSHGGLVQVGAKVARGEVSAVLLLIDARDPHHDDIQIQILKRVSNKRGVRLILTYGDAERWAYFEASAQADRPVTHDAGRSWKPNNWEDGHEITRHLSASQRTLALTANDGSKLALVDFVAKHVKTLVQHHRILATGTSGWLLKIMFATARQQPGFIETALRPELQEYLAKALAALSDTPPKKQIRVSDVREAVALFRSTHQITEHEAFADKVITLPPGPEGGDLLIANEVIAHRCDTVVSFHEPAESRPFGGGGRMLEQTCQLPKIYAGCLDNPRSAEGWARGLERELTGTIVPDYSHKSVRRQFKLREIVTVDFPDAPYTDEGLGRALARATAGFFQVSVERLIRAGGGRIVVSWGLTIRMVVDELKAMRESAGVTAAPDPSARLVWSPAIGVVSAHPTLGAESIVTELRDIYGGSVETFSRPAFVVEGLIPDADRLLMARLGDAKLVLMAGAPWSRSSSLYARSGLSPKLFPAVSDNVVGTVGGVFIDQNGSEVKGDGTHLVGLDHAGLIHASENGAVILVAGGASRRPVVHAALTGRLVSVLITSKETLSWLNGETNSSRDRKRPSVEDPGG